MIKRLFCFNEYKERLIKFYVHACDRDKYDERKTWIERNYKDEFFERIIRETEEAIAALLDKMKSENRVLDANIFTHIEMPSSHYDKFFQTISANVTGGWLCDMLYSIIINDRELLVSKNLLNNFFGEKIRIEFASYEIESVNEREDSGYMYEIPYVTISAPIDEFNKIYNDYNSPSEEEDKMIPVLAK